MCQLRSHCFRMYPIPGVYILWKEKLQQIVPNVSSNLCPSQPFILQEYSPYISRCQDSLCPRLVFARLAAEPVYVQLLSRTVGQGCVQKQGPEARLGVKTGHLCPRTAEPQTKACMVLGDNWGSGGVYRKGRKARGHHCGQLGPASWTLLRGV